MQTNNKANFFNVFKWITQQYLQLERRTLPYPFKLGYFDNGKNFIDKNRVTFAKIELSGQSEYFDIELPKIIEQNLFEYFSPSEKKILFSKYFNKVKFKLTDQYYCDKTKTDMVVLMEISTGNNLNLPASFISDNSELVEFISNSDVRKISFIAAMDYFKNIFKRN